MTKSKRDSSAWDPLDAKLMNTDFYVPTIKRHLNNILKSYTGWYDPICELMQNALDAVDERRRLGEADYIPKIWITIDLQKNLISVTDNGIGFDEEQFRTFLAPNVSFKVGETRGNKGVGATYLAYGFNYFQVGTKKDTFQFVGTLENGKTWVEDISGTKSRPTIKSSETIDENFKKIDRGSTFTLKFLGANIRPKNLSWTHAINANQWEMILRAKTPLGGIYPNDETHNHVCVLKVIDEDGKATKKEIESCEYLFPHNVISACKSLHEIRDKQSELQKNGKDISRFPSDFKKLNGVYGIWNYNDMIANQGGLTIRLDEEEKRIIKEHKIWAYSFQCYSTDIWDRYNDDVVKLRKGSRLIRGGLQLATNYMPQGDLILIPLTKNIGLQHTTHVVIHAYSADPDLGRKGFQPELKSLAEKIAVASVKPLRAWKHLLNPTTGAIPDITAEKEIYDWIKEQEEHEKAKPICILRQDFFLPLKEASLTSEPLNEQDVVSLFNQLLAGGVIRGIKIMSTSTHKKYDGICRFCVREPTEHHIFDLDDNPLGIERSKLKGGVVSKPKILEYKHNVDGLMEEIENGDKNAADIDLVVAWDMGTEWNKRYSIIPLLYLPNVHHREFHGVTHIVSNASTGDFIFYVIILKELINYLNDPERVQDVQNEKYSF